MRLLQRFRIIGLRFASKSLTDNLEKLGTQTIKLSIFKSTFIFLFSLSFVFAFGPSSPYWKDRPIYLNPGESLTFDITLQNLVGGEEVTLKASTNNNEIVLLPEGNPKEYIIPFGRDDIKVPVKISVPKSADIGTRYDIAVSFKQVPKAG